MGSIAINETQKAVPAKSAIPAACHACPNYKGYGRQGTCSVLTSLISPCFVDILRRKHEAEGTAQNEWWDERRGE